MVRFEGPEKKRKVLSSMLTLAALIGGAVLATAAITTYFRAQDPVNQCIADPTSEPYQVSVPIALTVDGAPGVVPEDVGISETCTRPVHTIEENVIHVAYGRPHDFTLGHFLYYWLGNDLLKYETKVYVNDTLHTSGDFRDIVLRQGDSLRIAFITKNQ
ncbi:MAG: hypothetical protein ACREAZ_00195 [Nitrososphaera sp.]